jgi:hypothetical protein
MEGSGAIPLKCMFYPANGFLGFMPPRLRTKPHSRFRLFRHHCLRTGACPRKSRDDRRRLLWTCFRYGRIRICSSRQPGGPDEHHFRLTCLLISAVDRITHGVPAEPRCGSSSLPPPFGYPRFFCQALGIAPGWVHTNVLRDLVQSLPP